MPADRPKLDLVSRRKTLLVVAVGVLLALPSLRVGFWADDHLHLAMIEGAPVLPETAPLDLFNLAGAGPMETSVPGTLGPWWTSPDFSGRFFRPLTSLTHQLDHALWGRWAPGHHITSILLWTLLLVVVCALLHELSIASGRGPPAAMMAGLLYALDEAHMVPVMWLANRNALVAVLFSVVSIHAFVRWRRLGRSRWIGLSLVAFALAALGGETAVAVPAWVVAWEICVSKGAAKERLLAASPLVLAAVAYLALYTGTGHGVVASGLYLSPLTDPLAFWGTAVPQRLPVLAAAMLTPLPSEIATSATPAGAWMLAGLSAVAVLVILTFLIPVLRRDRFVRFALLGSLLSLIPVCGTFPHNRLLLLPTVGVAWALGSWLDDFSREWWHARSRGFRPPRIRRAAAMGLLVVHGLLAAATWPAGALMIHHFGRQQVDLAIRAEIDETADVADDLVLLLNLPDPLAVLHLSTIRHLADLPDPAAIIYLSTAPAEQRLIRTGPTAFTLETRRPGYLRSNLELLYRSEPVAQGDRFDRYAEVGVEVHANRVERGHLLGFEVLLDRDLDSPDVVLLAWDGDRLARVEPPPVGGCTLVPFERPSMPTPPRQRWPAGACDPPAQTSPRAGGEPTDVPVAAGEPTVATPEPTCTLDLLVDGAWQTRAQVRCPGDEGLTFPVAGDVGRPGELLSASAGQMHAICEELGCSLMLLPGDLIYGPGEQADATWRAVWDDTLAGLDLPALAVFGNHAYRHEPGPARRREVLLASDGRAGFVLPGPSWTARVARDGEALVAFAGLDTDSLAVPRPDAPGLGEQALHDACATGAPVVLVGHHPASSQGLHHDHEHHVRRGLRALSRAVIQGDGCRLVLATAGHDHDQQVVPPGCQEALNPGIVVSGVAARGYRVRGSSHLEPCPASGANGSYHFGPREAGGFALVRVRPGDGATTVTLYDVPAAGERTILGEVSW